MYEDRRRKVEGIKENNEQKIVVAYSSAQANKQLV